jgi:hypothetical protein
VNRNTWGLLKALGFLAVLTVAYCLTMQAVCMRVWWRYGFGDTEEVKYEMEQTAQRLFERAQRSRDRGASGWFWVWLGSALHQSVHATVKWER